jgi:hypothetical protein
MADSLVNGACTRVDETRKTWKRYLDRPLSCLMLYCPLRLTVHTQLFAAQQVPFSNIYSKIKWRNLTSSNTGNSVQAIKGAYLWHTMQKPQSCEVQVILGFFLSDGMLSMT